jgi:hypothetical protein
MGLVLGREENCLCVVHCVRLNASGVDVLLDVSYLHHVSVHVAPDLQASPAESYTCACHQTGRVTGKAQSLSTGHQRAWAIFN